MKDIKDVLLYLDSFDENNMFDFDTIINYIMYQK